MLFLRWAFKSELETGISRCLDEISSYSEFGVFVLRWGPKIVKSLLNSLSKSWMLYIKLHLLASDMCWEMWLDLLMKIIVWLYKDKSRISDFRTGMPVHTDT